MELLRELVPTAVRVAVLINPTGPVAEAALSDVEPAARAMGLQTQVLNASTSRIDAVFETIGRERFDALFVAPDPFFSNRRVQLVHLATLHKVAATYPQRQWPEVGGLMSYGSNVADAYRQMGVYVGRILKGAKPADLPVVQASKFELVINHQTARMLGLTVPPMLLARADEVTNKLTSCASFAAAHESGWARMRSAGAPYEFPILEEELTRRTSSLDRRV